MKIESSGSAEALECVATLKSVIRSIPAASYFDEQMIFNGQGLLLVTLPNLNSLRGRHADEFSMKNLHSNF